MYSKTEDTWVTSFSHTCTRRFLTLPTVDRASPPRGSGMLCEADYLQTEGMYAPWPHYCIVTPPMRATSTGAQPNRHSPWLFFQSLFPWDSLGTECFPLIRHRSENRVLENPQYCYVSNKWPVLLEVFKRSSSSSHHMVAEMCLYVLWLFVFFSHKII
jgi:hypothetical protein